MKILITLITGALLTAAFLLHADDTEPKDSAEAQSSCCAPASDDKAKGHPLRGVVQSWVAERNALLVKHEEIPGIMRAMTMMFEVDVEELPPVKAGDTISAVMKRSDSGAWLLEEVQVID